jgi:hypothetical protein
MPFRLSRKVNCGDLATREYVRGDRSNPVTLGELIISWRNIYVCIPMPFGVKAMAFTFATKGRTVGATAVGFIVMLTPQLTFTGLHVRSTPANV